MSGSIVCHFWSLSLKLRKSLSNLSSSFPTCWNAVLMVGAGAAIMEPHERWQYPRNGRATSWKKPGWLTWLLSLWGCPINPELLCEKEIRFKPLFLLSSSQKQDPYSKNCCREWKRQQASLETYWEFLTDIWIFSLSLSVFWIWRRHLSVCKLKENPHATKGHHCKNQDGVLGVSLAQKLGSVRSSHPSSTGEAEAEEQFHFTPDKHNILIKPLTALL